MYIAILGRQPALGMAELEHLYGAASTHWFSDQTATVKTDTLSIERLGGKKLAASSSSYRLATGTASAKKSSRHMCKHGQELKAKLH